MIMNTKQYHHVTAQSSVSRQSGFSLLEVLIAVVILSVGLLGLAGMQVTSLKYVTSSLQRTQATSLAYDILDRMRANPNGIYATGYGDPASKYTQTCLGAVTCDAATMVDYDLSEWKTAIETLLPGGQGDIPERIGNRVQVKVHWIDRRDQKNADQNMLEITMRTEL